MYLDSGWFGFCSWGVFGFGLAAGVVGWVLSCSASLSGVVLLVLIQVSLLPSGVCLLVRGLPCWYRFRIFDFCCFWFCCFSIYF